MTRAAVGLAGAALLACVGVLLVIPLLVGGEALTVRTGSMAPAVAVGAVVVVRPVPAADLHVGDIATYRQAGSGNLVTHRIVAVTGSGAQRTFTFRGDANPVADPVAVPASAVLGRVWFDVPVLGRVRNVLGERRGVLVWTGVACLSLVSCWQFLGAWRERGGRS